MKIVVSWNIPLAEKAFAPLGEVTVLTRPLRPEDLAGADTLVARSDVRLDRALLAEAPLRFVGTTTIGTDHVDLAYLESRGIAFANAPGCNANSVKEYVAAALFRAAAAGGFSLAGKTLGVVGVGNVGTRVVQAAEALGLRVLRNDPPRARREGPAGFVALEEALAADIVTVHVPLTRQGPDATWHLLDAGRLARLREGAVLLNTSRGAVVDNAALSETLAAGRLAAAVLDVWEGEPAFDPALLGRVLVGTPHIAGHSLQGKINGVRQVRDALFRHCGVPEPWPELAEENPPAPVEVRIPPSVASAEEILRRAVEVGYDIGTDDAALRGIAPLPAAERARRFEELRAHYRVRREFPAVRVHLADGQEAAAAPLRALGFRCAGPE